jgi:hypothetical protein
MESSCAGDAIPSPADGLTFTSASLSFNSETVALANDITGLVEAPFSDVERSRPDNGLATLAAPSSDPSNV